MIANLEDFEFAALQKADHYRAALLCEFQPFLIGSVLEIGAGTGQLSEALLQKPEIERFTTLEPNPRFASRLRGRRSSRPSIAISAIFAATPGPS